jgi:integrase/recombinase XerD
MISLTAFHSVLLHLCEAGSYVELGIIRPICPRLVRIFSQHNGLQFYGRSLFSGMTILHKLFVRVHARYTSSPHVEDLAAFAHWLLEHDYLIRYAQRLVFRAMRVLDSFDLPSGSVWTSEQLDRAFCPYWHRRTYRHARHTLGVFLQSVDRLAPPQDHSPHASALTAYRSYLSEVRGLVPVTIINQIAEVRALLRDALPSGKPLEHLTAHAIEQYIKQRARGVTRRTLQTCIGFLRAFLRYCFDRNLIATPLDLLDQPVCFRDELPPRALDWPLIQKLLRSVDRTDRSGWRDFMMLHLMAHYGLRPGEVTRLTVDSINWEDRTLLVEQPKTCSWLTLPLMDETLDLLRRYLKEGRRQNGRMELFTSAIAPYGPVSNCNVVQLFKNRARKSGLPIAHASPYALRHSFAMRLFARGIGIKVIGDLMGHGSLVSTSIYLRLQTDALREVALPVPVEVGMKGGAA